MSVGQIKLGYQHLSILKMSLGWIVSGKYKQHTSNKAQVCSVNDNTNYLDSLVKCFWALEQVPEISKASSACERNFKQTIHRLASDRFTVKLPFKMDPNGLGFPQISCVEALTRKESRVTCHVSRIYERVPHF